MYRVLDTAFRECWIKRSLFAHCRNTVKKYVDGLVTPADKPTRVRGATKIEAAIAAIEEYLESNPNGHTNKQRITVPTLLTEVNKLREKANQPELSRTTVQSGVASRNGKNRTLRVLEHSQWQESAFFDFDRLPGVVTS
jgi:hypothetical protein